MIIFLVPMALMLGAWFLADHFLPGFGSASMIVVAILYYGFLYRWMCYIQNQERKILGVIQHHVFGEVALRRTGWEAEVTHPEVGHLLVSGELPEGPDENEVAGFKDFCERHKSMRCEWDDAADAFGAEDAIPPRPRRFAVETLLLDYEDPRGYVVGLEIEGSAMAGGFTAWYREGKLDEFVDDH